MATKYSGVKELILLGTEPSSVECPYDHEVWGVNRVYKFAKRIDRLFCIGSVDELEDIREYQAELGFDIVDTSNYPIYKVMDYFQTDYFSDTVCYMMALALIEGYERIYLYGVDMLGEYAVERNGVEYWVGRAIGKGAQVINTFGSAVCKGKMYGFWGNMEWKLNP